MTTQQFEKMIVWQHAKSLAIALYESTENLKDYSFRDQICRATISISNNIAEGIERHGPRELKKFLYSAKGSAGEVRSMMHVGIALGYFSNLEGEKIIEGCTTISKMLAGFIKSL